MNSQPDIHATVLNNKTHIGVRLLFGCFGLVPLIWPAWDLQPWTIPFGIFAVFFWIIVLGAMALGLAIILLMVFAPQQQLTISPSEIKLDRHSIFGASHRDVTVSDVEDVTLERTEWQDGPDSFSIRVSLKGATNFVTSPIASEAEAQKLLQQTKDALDGLRAGG